VKIRVAETSEAAGLAAFQQRVALFAYRDIFPPEAPPPTLDELAAEWRTRLDDETARCFVAEEAGVIVGIAFAGRGTLARLYVEPDRWGEGIGRTLYDRCVEHLSESGCDAITLRVLEANTRVREWYERLGWTLAGERIPVYEPGGVDDVVYRLELTRSTPS
jgi:ribosomal protein S18 acetylase RimI-like enzyme